MKIILAPDSFKESLSARQVCRALEKGIRKVYPRAQIRSLPMGDGGEGTLDAWLSAAGGKIQTCRVRDPLGKRISARYGLLDGGRTALIESAAASGLALVPPERRNPLITSSYGTGEMIAQALDRGCRKVILTLGGVATNDAGAGLARALGFRLLDSKGREIGPGAQGLLDLSRIEASGTHPRLRRVSFVAACDVKNPLCGPQGSAAVYGPQKGATRAMIPRIDRALRRFAQVARRDLGVSVLNAPGGGAAGGAGAGALAFLKARLSPGVDMVLEAVRFREIARGADWVVTGEGRVDGQTVFGKTPAGVARAARRMGLPVLAFCGRIGAGAERVHDAGIAAVFPIAPGPLAPRESFARAAELLEQRAEQVFRLIRTSHEKA